MLVRMDTYFDGEYWYARYVNEGIFAQSYDELFKEYCRGYTLAF